MCHCGKLVILARQKSSLAKAMQHIQRYRVGPFLLVRRVLDPHLFKLFQIMNKKLRTQICSVAVARPHGSLVTGWGLAGAGFGFSFHSCVLGWDHLPEMSRSVFSQEKQSHTNSFRIIHSWMHLIVRTKTNIIQDRDAPKFLLERIVADSVFKNYANNLLARKTKET